MQSRVQLAFCAARALCWLMSSCYPSVIPVLFSRAVLHPVIIQLVLVVAVTTTQLSLHLELLNLMRFSWAHSDCLSFSGWYPILLVYQSPLGGHLQSTEGVHSLIVSLISEDTKQHWSQQWPLRDTTHHWSPSRQGAMEWYYLVPSCNQFLIHQKVHPSNPHLSNLDRRILQGTVSKALLKFSSASVKKIYNVKHFFLLHVCTWTTFLYPNKWHAHPPEEAFRHIMFPIPNPSTQSTVEVQTQKMKCGPLLLWCSWVEQLK